MLSPKNGTALAYSLASYLTIRTEHLLRFVNPFMVVITSLLESIIVLLVRGMERFELRCRRRFLKVRCVNGYVLAS
jgi:hypothetical protein